MDPTDHPHITLVPPTARDLEAFAREEIADYALSWAERHAVSLARS